MWLSGSPEALLSECAAIGGEGDEVTQKKANYWCVQYTFPNGTTMLHHDTIAKQRRESQKKMTERYPTRRPWDHYAATGYKAVRVTIIEGWK